MGVVEREGGSGRERVGVVEREWNWWREGGSDGEERERKNVQKTKQAVHGGPLDL